MNLSARHGSANGILTDSVVQEIDIKTGLVMWEWHALGHISLGESNNPRAAQAAIRGTTSTSTRSTPAPSGDVLLSARNTWTLYDVDIHTGGFSWRLGGAHSSFKLGSGTRFYWQHDAEFQPGGLISMFDNGSDPPKEKQSRGLLLAPNVVRRTRSAWSGSSSTRRKTLLAESQGNTLSLPGGNWLLGYGGCRTSPSSTPPGTCSSTATLGKNVQNFQHLPLAVERSADEPRRRSPRSPPAPAG